MKYLAFTGREPSTARSLVGLTLLGVRLMRPVAANQRLTDDREILLGDAPANLAQRLLSRQRSPCTLHSQR